MDIPTLETNRLRLRPFATTDVAPMVEILGGHDVLRYFPRTDAPGPERVQRMIDHLLAHWDEHDYGLWALEWRATGELLGRCGLQYLSETDDVEVDFILGRPFWGKGFATEAGRASLAWGFAELDIERIVGIVHVDNIASQRVLEKLGMRRVEQAEYFGMTCYRYQVAAVGVRPAYE